MQSSRRPPLREQRLDVSGKSAAFIYYSEILPAHRSAFAGAPVCAACGIETLDSDTRTRQPVRDHRAGETAVMSKPVRSEAELIAMARAELKVHADCPDGIVISVLRSNDSWEFRASADAATAAKPGYPECVAMLVQIGDHLRKQYDVSG
jgi:hypothetical protein